MILEKIERTGGKINCPEFQYNGYMGFLINGIWEALPIYGIVIINLDESFKITFLNLDRTPTEFSSVQVAELEKEINSSEVVMSCICELVNITPLHDEDYLA